LNFLSSLPVLSCLRPYFFPSLPVSYVLSFLGVGLRTLVSLLLVRVLTRYLGAEGYGIWAQAIALAMLIGPFLILSLDKPLLRYSGRLAREDRELVTPLLWWTVGSTILVGGTVYLLSPFLLHLTILPDRSFVLLLLLYSVAFNLTMLVSEYLRSMSRVVFYSVYLVIRDLGLLLILLLLLLLDFKLESLFIAAVLWFVIFVSLSVVTSGSLIVRSNEKSRRRSVRLFGSEIKSSFNFALPILLGHLPASLGKKGGFFTVGILLGTAAVGSYAVGKLYSELLLLVGTAVLIPLKPKVSHLYDTKDYIGVRKTLFRWSFRLLLLGLTIAVLSIWTAKPILSLLSTPSIADEIASAVPIFFLSSTILLVTAIVLEGLWAAESTWSYSMFWIVGGIVTVVLGLLLIPSLGLRGAAVAELVASLSYGVLAGTVTLRKLNALLRKEKDLVRNYSLS
jgi:O-antigen/teichoic acid export membrane protein